MFTNILEAKKKTSYRRVGAAKSKRKAIKFWNYNMGIETKAKV